MSEVGKKLKSAREQKEISLQEIGLALKISPRIISSIESGEKSGQPAKTFLRGFVKSYALYLKMDVSEVLRLFDSEYSVEPIASKAIQVEPMDSTAASTKIATPKTSNPSEVQVRAPFPSFPWGKAFLAVLLFVGIVVLAKVVHKYQRERDLPVQTVTGETEQKESPLTPVLDPSSTPEIKPTPSPEPTATPTL